MQKNEKHGQNYSFSEFLMRTEPGRTDLERKSLADEREAYKGTLSEETRIKQKTLIKTKKTIGFQP